MVKMIKFDLGCCPYLNFQPKEIELGPVNFIYGRNGTGKSTIASLLVKKFEEKYDVQKFDGFENYLAENKVLNAITLGPTNTEIQPKIDDLDAKIQEAEKQLDPDSKEDNYATRLAQAQQSYEKSHGDLKKFYTEAASSIKGETNPSISKVSYDKRDFEQEIEQAKKLSDDELQKAKEECLARELPDPDQIEYPTIDIASLTQESNDLLATSITSTIQLPEIGDDASKQNFAKLGMEVHDRESDKCCAFCGGQLTRERWDQLDKLFDNAADAFQKRIFNTLTDITAAQEALETLGSVNAQQYYPPFREQIDEINRQIRETKVSVDQYLKHVHQRLIERQQHLFGKLDPIQESQPSWNAQELQQRFDQLFEENCRYGISLNEQQQRARDSLRYHHIATLLEQGEYAHKLANLKDAEAVKKKAEDERQGQIDELSDLYKNKEKLIEQTSSEEVAATYINRVLQSLGDTSFELRLIASDSGAKGQYRIFSAGKERDVDTLSTGERNLIAFLYFMQVLEGLKTSQRLMVIMDDPMNSNDEASQYIMYSYIQQLCNNKNSIFSNANARIFVLLTHNAHFFLNARPNKWDPRCQKQFCFTLRKAGGVTAIRRIADRKDDIQTSYGALWQELRFAYDENRPAAMWNPLRRIIETFSDFNAVESLHSMITNENRSVVDCTIAAEIKKSADVSSHGLFEISTDLTGHTREQIMDFAKWYFKNADGERHFERFWNGSSH